MHILVFTQGVQMFGANRCLLDMMEGMRKYHVKFTIVLPKEGAFSSVLKELGYDLIISEYHNWASTKYISKGYWFQKQRTKENENNLDVICTKVAPLGIDIVYSNSSIIGIGAMVAERLNKKHVWHIREFGEKDYDMVFYKGRNDYIKWVNKSAAVISMSQAIVDETLNGLNQTPTVIYDGIIPRDKLSDIALNKHENDIVTFLIIGTLRKSKGQHIALKAFQKLYKKHKNTRLLIAGSGRRLFTLSLKLQAKLMGIAHAVEFLGYVKNPYDVHKDADVVLMCSQSEGMGRVTLEGMLFANPVIGFNRGGTSELISHDKDGYLYDNGIAELAEYMSNLVEDKKKRLIMGQNGRKKIATSFCIEDSVSQIYEIFNNVMK